MCLERLKAEFCKKNFLLGYDRPSEFAEPVVNINIFDHSIILT